MADLSFRLEHLNLPARDPEGLAGWYAGNFGLHADRHLVRGPGVLIAFQRGEPVGRAEDVHLGLRVPSLESLEAWAAKFGVQTRTGPEFITIKVFDPEGNCIEMYTPSA